MLHTSQVLLYTHCGPGTGGLGYGSNASFAPQQKNLHLHVRTACIAKLTRREWDPSTPHPCTTAPSTRHSRGFASAVASAGSSPASLSWPTHPGREASPHRKKRGTPRLAAAACCSLPTSPAHCRLRALLSRSLSLPTPPAGCRLLASLDAHALCPVRPGVGRQPAPCLSLGLQQARWLGLRQVRCGVVAVVYIPQEMRPLVASGWR